MMLVKIGAVGTSILLVMGSLVFPAFAQEEEAEAIVQTEVLQPAKAFLVQLYGYLPKLGGLLVILVVGCLIAAGVAALIRWFLRLIRLEKLLQKIKVPGVLNSGGIRLSFCDLVAAIIFFLLVIATLLVALEFYGLDTKALVGPVLSFVPRVIAGAFILIIGILLAIFISGVIRLVEGNTRITQAGTLGNIAKYVIIIFAGLAALKEIGLGVILTGGAQNIILGGIVLSLALAFGLGAKDKAGRFLDSIFGGSAGERE